MKLRKYISLIRAGIVESLQFRSNFIVIMVGNIIYLTIVYFLWKAIYASSGTEIVNGMTFTDTLIYLVLATALFNCIEVSLVWIIGSNIQTGQIVLDLLKPMQYRTYMIWSLCGNVFMQFVMTFMPTFVIVYFMTNGAIHLGCNLLYFVVAFVMAIIINFSIEFITGTICIYTQSVWGINIMKQVIVALLSGATIPIAFFPEPLKKIVYCLPFQSVYNTPLTLLISNEMPLSKVGSALGVQLLWCVIMIVISKVFWKVSVRQITVNGG